MSDKKMQRSGKTEKVNTQFTFSSRLTGWIFVASAVVALIVYFQNSDNNFFLILAFACCIIWRLLIIMNKQEAEKVRNERTENEKYQELIKNSEPENVDTYHESINQTEDTSFK